MLELNLTQGLDADLNGDWLKQLPSADADKAWSYEGFKTLGGKGSGNFGHVGRPGKVGGSGGGFEVSINFTLPSGDSEDRLILGEYDVWGDKDMSSLAGQFGLNFEGMTELEVVGNKISDDSFRIGFAAKGTGVIEKLGISMTTKANKVEKAYLDAMFLSETGTGLGRKLTDKITNTFKELGATEVIIGGRKTTDIGLKVWPKFGFEKRKGMLIKTLGGKGSGHHGHAGRKGKVGGSAPKGQFDASEWKDLGFMERKEAWQALSVKERDRLTNASSSINERINAVTAYAGSRPSFEMGFSEAIYQRADQLKELATAEARQKIIETVKELDSSLGEAGVPDELRHKLNMDATDVLFVQENEALGRSLGDHGIAHIQGNIAMSMTMLDEIPGEISARDKAAVYIAGIYHDTGYVAAPSHYFLDEGHPRWSMQHYNNNVKSAVAEALGIDRSEEISHIIRTHDSTDINWLEDPAGSAFRVSDNLALFAKEKTPALFRYVPENHWVLQQLGEGKLSVEKAQETMRYNIEATSYNKWIKHELTRSVQEVSPMLPKFTLGMKAGVVDDLKWVDDHIKVSLRKTPEYDYLTKSLDLGQKQFSKLAETYGVDADGFKKDLSFSYKNQAGSILLEGIVVNEEGFIILNDVFVTNIKFLGVTQQDFLEMGERPYCKAFMVGIPDEIAYGDDKHEEIIVGQIGSFIFEEKTDGN